MIINVNVIVDIYHPLIRIWMDVILVHKGIIKFDYKF